MFDETKLLSLTQPHTSRVTWSHKNGASQRQHILELLATINCNHPLLCQYGAREVLVLVLAALPHAPMDRSLWDMSEHAAGF